jgi:hypothetical protein
MLLLRVGSGGIAWQKWGLFIAMITMSYDWIGQVLRTFQFISPSEVVLLLVASPRWCTRSTSSVRWRIRVGASIWQMWAP